MKTRQEHLDWCKRRANEYLERGDISNAITSMMSDMQKHPETKFDNPVLNALGLKAAMSSDREEARRYIDGFN